MQNINTNDKIKGKVHKIHAPPPKKNENPAENAES